MLGNDNIYPLHRRVPITELSLIFRSWTSNFNLRQKNCYIYFMSSFVVSSKLINNEIQLNIWYCQLWIPGSCSFVQSYIILPTGHCKEGTRAKIQINYSSRSCTRSNWSHGIVNYELWFTIVMYKIILTIFLAIAKRDKKNTVQIIKLMSSSTTLWLFYL